MEIVHTPVMLDEVRSVLAPSCSEARMLDCTLGEGGHAEAFLSAYPGLRYMGIDADPRIQAKARERLAPFAPRVEFRLGYYDLVLEELLRDRAAGGPAAPDRILFDLGISMYHYLEAGRGFGFGKDEALDMRLSPEAPRSAAEILNEEREEELARIIFEYGEERYSRRIARAVVEERRGRPVWTSGRLAELVYRTVPPAQRHGRIHPATRTFQALRIAVNDELARIERGLARAAALLAPGGIIAVISFHSLEDRIVKNLFRSLARPPREEESDSTRGEGAPMMKEEAVEFELLFKKPLEPRPEETARNPASRSAKLRGIRKKVPVAGKARI